MPNARGAETLLNAKCPGAGTLLNAKCPCRDTIKCQMPGGGTLLNAKCLGGGGGRDTIKCQTPGPRDSSCIKCPGFARLGGGGCSRLELTRTSGMTTIIFSSEKKVNSRLRFMPLGLNSGEIKQV